MARAVGGARRGRRRSTGWAIAAGVAAGGIRCLACGALARSRAAAGGYAASRPARSSIGRIRAPTGRPDAGAAVLRYRRYAPRGPRVLHRAALRARARIDRASRVVFDERDVASLEEGAAYVDSGIHPGRSRVRDFGLRTAAGTVRHVGTQYEARWSQPVAGGDPRRQRTHRHTGRRGVRGRRRADSGRRKPNHRGAICRRTTRRGPGSARSRLLSSSRDGRWRSFYAGRPARPAAISCTPRMTRAGGGPHRAARLDRGPEPRRIDCGGGEHDRPRRRGPSWSNRSPFRSTLGIRTTVG